MMMRLSILSAVLGVLASMAIAAPDPALAPLRDRIAQCTAGDECSPDKLRAIRRDEFSRWKTAHSSCNQIASDKRVDTHDCTLGREWGDEVDTDPKDMLAPE